MTYNDAESYIHSFTRFGSQLGLERMGEFLNRLGNPQDKLKFIHIAGTNGKGTSANMCSRILREAGYKTALYTSPFVSEFRERFQINGKMIEKTEFSEIVHEIIPVVDKMAAGGMQVTEFEVVTAIALVWFERCKADIVCFEVGLGGRFDATNIISTPLAAIITSISFDHMSILGNSIKEIAFEKAGIIKQSTDVITYPLQNIDATAVLMEACAKNASRLIQPNASAVEIFDCGPLGSSFSYKDKLYKIKLAGKHQVYNAVGVIEAMGVLIQKGYVISEENIYEGLRKTAFPARFEIMNRKPLIIVDGAHNREGTQALAQTLKTLKSERIVAVIGMMADKDCKNALRYIGEAVNSIITVPVYNNPRSIGADELCAIAKSYCGDCSAEANYMKALKTAIQKADGGAVIICGSFYLSSDMRKIVKEYKKATKEQ